MARSVKNFTLSQIGQRRIGGFIVYDLSNWQVAVFPWYKPFRFASDAIGVRIGRTLYVLSFYRS
jgi:hypothetical protein